jgi:hypothetical protein
MSASELLEAICPILRSALRVDQLTCDTRTLGSSGDAPFQHIAHAEVSSHSPDVDRFSLVCEARVAATLSAAVKPTLTPLAADVSANGSTLERRSGY